MSCLQLPFSREPGGCRRDDNHGISWIEVSGGFLAARPMPRDEVELKTWNCTALVTLTEDARHVATAVELLGLRWLHLPIAPISNAKKPVSGTDFQSFSAIPNLLRWLRAGERLVVHCYA